MEKEKEEENRRNRNRSGDDDDTDCEGSKARRKADSTVVADDDDADIPPLLEKYDVFISFRGKDTRCTFTCHLHEALVQKKIITYIDNNLKRGEEIGPALLEAIKKSKLWVIIFSKNYATSAWCLDELVLIMECNKKREGQFVIPIFYHTDVSDVRDQQGSYAAGFAQHQSIDKVDKWKEALKNAANISGFPHPKNAGMDTDLIKKVVKDIWTKLGRESSCDLEGLVGIQSSIKKVEELLDIHSKDGCIAVGIWGMGGIGKTTLAEAVFHKHSSKFDACCFLRNVTEKEQKDGLENLEKTLLKDILKEEGLSIGSDIVRRGLSRTKVLIVLDDVSDSTKMERLAGKGLRYGTGSRIIITSRDRRTLTVEEGKIYKVEGLKPEKALQFFYLRAFKNNSTPGTYFKELAEKAVYYARGVPLALKLLGSSFLYCESIEDWKDELDKLEESPNEDVQRVLKLSYDRLGSIEKEIFLDIACFHRGMDVNEVKKRLAIRTHSVAARIKVLIDMSLISVHSKQGRETIEIHDLLEEMGRTIVLKQGIEDPCKRSRLFNDEDVFNVLKSNKETPNVQAIKFNWSQCEEQPFEPADFKVMSNLKLLIVDYYPGHPRKFTTSLDLPNSLRYLHWWGYLLESLPSKFSPENLVELHMPYSQVKKLWKKDERLVNLEVIDLHDSMYLMEVPNLFGSPKIGHINLSNWRSLVDIPSYFQHLHKLTHLHLRHCTCLEYLPEMPRSIKYLDLQSSGIKELHESVWSNENISYLNISHCKDLEKLPSNRCKLKVSGCFSLDGCTSLGEFSELPRDITELSLVRCSSIVSLPINIWKLKYLKKLNLDGCSEFEHFPEILEPIEHLVSLSLRGTAVQKLPSSFGNLIGLQTLDLSGCKHLKVVPTRDVVADSTAVVDDVSPEEYDVFISFRGEDTRFGITSHLHVALLQKKIETYIDNRLQRGEEIGPALLETIEKSKILVIIFSQNYASSTWCLDELLHILKCRERYGHMVVPVFYDINPSDVRKQHGTYADAFAQLEERFKDNIDKVCTWRAALTNAANLSGFDYSNKFGREADLIKNVVNHVWAKVICESSWDLEGPVGIASRIQQIEELLGIHSQDACIIVGIWGMGGIGKTTLAEVVFNKLSSKFEACCFLRNVRETEQKGGLEHLQNKLLSQILEEEGLSIGSTFVRARLSRTKVLIVLDDVSDSMQMEGLVGNRLRFGTGSRIIITSRNRGTLGQIVEGDKIYEVGRLKPDDARRLFYLHASKSIRITDYKELAEKAMHYAGGIPLALILLGSSFLNCKSKEDLEDELDKLKQFPNENIRRVLRLSYDGLGIAEKEIFLDIACFYKGENVKKVKQLLDFREFHATIGIRILIDRSLISIDSRWGQETIEMHDLLEEMGRAIVQEQCIEDPGKRSRLFNDEDVYHVLKSNTETSNVEAIFLTSYNIAERPLKRVDFKVMSNLRLLVVYGGYKFNASIDLPNSLRYLEWWGYPLEYLPSNFSPENLVELHMPNSKVKKLWKEEKRLVNLQVIDLHDSTNLTEVPNLSGSLNIVNINLSGCESLVEIPGCFQHLDKLTHLHLRFCTSLKYLPRMPRNIKYLDLHYAGIKELPESQHLHKLTHLDLACCMNLKYLPEMPGNIEYLDLHFNGIEELPESVWSNENISYLDIRDCYRLEKNGKFNQAASILM